MNKCCRNEALRSRTTDRNPVTPAGVEDDMRSRRLVVASLAVIFVLLTGLPAVAKGPGSATISGPGGSVEVSPGNYQYHDQDPFWDLQSESGVIPLALMDGDELGTRPVGDLGEPLIVTWEMGDRDIVQFMYMNAEGGPVAHVEPDPANGVRGGWHRTLPSLRTALEDLGIEIPPPDPGTVIKRILSTLTAGMISKI